MPHLQLSPCAFQPTPAPVMLHIRFLPDFARARCGRYCEVCIMLSSVFDLSCMTMTKI